MFGNSMTGPLDSDPIFQLHSQHRQRMEAMFQDPFGTRSMPQMMLTNGREHQRDRQRRGERQRPDEVATRPMFAHHMMGNMFGNMMSDMRSMMNSMQPHINSMQSQMLQTGEADRQPGGNFFSQSTVMSYSNDGSKPKVYQASTSTMQTGGVKEVRQSVRDSEKGIEKIAVAHHIGDRSHTIKKERDRRTGDMNEEQELINLDEDEVPQFDHEWKHKTRNHHRNRIEGYRSNHRSHDRAPRGIGYVPSPIEGKPAKRTTENRGDMGVTEKHIKENKKRK